MYKDLDEQVSVIAVFEKDTLKPLRFLWQGRTFRIANLKQQAMRDDDRLHE